MSTVLGIDIGTTAVAAVVIEADSGKLLSVCSKPTQADLAALPHFVEQDVSRILSVLDQCVLNLPKELREEVRAVGVTGQMHGVMLWNSDSEETSSLITWQDRRSLDGDFLEELQKKTGDFSIRSGFGCATLAWLAANDPDKLRKYDNASTIADFLVSRFCGLTGAYTDPSDAASWGFYDLMRNEWDHRKVELAGIPCKLLPEIRPCGSTAGPLTAASSGIWDLSQGAQVMVALGDNQASLFATMSDADGDIALNLGTSGQLAVVLEQGCKCLDELPETIEIRPYLDNQLVAVAASLCGGSAMAWLPEVVACWCKDLNQAVPEPEAVYRCIDQLGLKSLDSSLDFVPCFIGERTKPDLRASISNIEIDNFTLGNIAVALARGVLTNLKDMLPSSMLRERKRVVGSGNALRRSLLMQRLVGSVFALPLRISPEQEEAAVGAARLAARNELL